MAKVGIQGFRYALQTADTVAALTYSDPVLVPGVVSVDIKTGKDTATLFADDGPFETASALGEITVDIELADLSLEVQAALLGHPLTNGVLKPASADAAPYVAIGFVGTKANGKKRWVWLLKGQFGEPDDTYKSRTDKIEFQTAKISGKFVITTHNGQYKQVTDEDATGYVAASGAAFIAAVPTA